MSQGVELGAYQLDLGRSGFTKVTCSFKTSPFENHSPKPARRNNLFDDHAKHIGDRNTIFTNVNTSHLQWLSISRQFPPITAILFRVSPPHN